MFRDPDTGRPWGDLDWLTWGFVALVALLALLAVVRIP